MPFAICNGIKLWHEKRGSGPRLLYISGTGGDLRRPPTAFSVGYHSWFETLAYDQRGMGRTDKPEETYSMAQYADDAASLLDVVGWHDCCVLGFSFGGMVAQEFALRHGPRVRKLVIAGATSGGAGGSSFPMERFVDMPQDDMLKLRIATMDIRHNSAWQAANGGEFQKLYDQALAAAQFGKDEPGREAGARRQLEARANHNTYDRLPQLTMPVLVCGGRFDGIATPQAVEKMARNIPNAGLALFDDGHFFLHQDPAAQRRIVDFLSSETTNSP